MSTIGDPAKLPEAPGGPKHPDADEPLFTPCALTIMICGLVVGLMAGAAAGLTAGFQVDTAAGASVGVVVGILAGFVTGVLTCLTIAQCLYVLVGRHAKS